MCRHVEIACRSRGLTLRAHNEIIKCHLHFITNTGQYRTTASDVQPLALIVRCNRRLPSRSAVGGSVILRTTIRNDSMRCQRSICRMVCAFESLWVRYDFLLVRYSKFGHILHRFGDIAGFLCFQVTPPLYHPNFGGVHVVQYGIHGILFITILVDTAHS